MKLKGSEIIMESLLREGVDVMFGYPGGAILPTYDAMSQYEDRCIMSLCGTSRALPIWRMATPGDRESRRLHRHQRTGRDQSGNRAGDRDDGFISRSSR